MLRTIITALLTIGLCQGAYAARADKPSDLFGRWTLNTERTAEVQPETPTHTGRPNVNLSPSVSIMGIPVPGTGGQGGQGTVAGTAKDPAIIHARDIDISPVGNAVQLAYAGLETEVLEIGRGRGDVRTELSKRSLTSRYKSTTRKVTKTLELQRDDTLLVTVRIKPKRSKGRLYRQVFDRVVE